MSESKPMTLPPIPTEVFERGLLLEIRLLEVYLLDLGTHMPTTPYEQAVWDQMEELERALEAEGLDALVRGAYEAAEKRFFRFIADTGAV